MDINLLKTHLHTINDMSNTTQRNLFEDVEDVEDVGVDNEIVFDFFENYFGDNLNEDTTEDDIFNAIIELNEISSGVYEFATGDNAFESIAMEYFASYFGDNLNEDTTDEDIENAVEQLLHTCHEVNEYFQIEEGFFKNTGKKMVKYGALAGAGYLAYKNRHKLGRAATDFAIDAVKKGDAKGAIKKVRDSWHAVKGAWNKFGKSSTQERPKYPATTGKGRTPERRSTFPSVTTTDRGGTPGRSNSRKYVPNAAK